MAEDIIIDVPVVIVGGGPVGLTLSCILGKNGIQHVVLEKNETTTKWPKAILTNTRSMGLYRRLGLDTVLRDVAMPENHQVIGCGSLINGKPIIRVDLTQSMSGKNPHLDQDGTVTYDEQWTMQHVCRLSQLYMEPALKTAAGKHSSSDLKYGWQVVSISQTQDNVVVEAVNVNSGEKKLYRAHYAVGCDGGKSFVRKSTGIHFKGKFDLGQFKTMSFQSEELRKRLTAGDVMARATFNSSCHFSFVFPINTEGLFVTHIFPRNKDAEPDELVRALMDNEDIPYKMVFTNNWQGHFAHAETFQDGRIFLAGDACHIMIPVGGFGLNTGIVDAFDLGWKLVATIQGWGGEGLLPSYTVERLPSIRQVLKRTNDFFDLVKKYGLILGFLFNTRPFKNILEMVIPRLNMDPTFSGILFGTRLDSSPLCIPGGHPLPPEDPVQYTQIAYPGCRAPHHKFEDGSSLYDKLGSMFTLLHLEPSNQNYDPILAAAAHCGIPLKVISLNDPTLKKLYREMDLVIIRPDMYIAWCGNEVPTLLHKEDVNEGARVLMKVITGAASLPEEWQQSSKNRGTMRALSWLPVALCLAVGVASASVTLLRRYKWID